MRDAFKIFFILLLLLLLPLPPLAAQTTLGDDFDFRGIRTLDLSPVSPLGLSWNQVEGEVRVDTLIAQPTTPNSLAMMWPRENGIPQNTIVVANEITDWNVATIDLAWSSKYVAGTAGMVLLYQNPQTFYFIGLGALQDGKLIRRVNGTDTILASGDIDPPFNGEAVITNYRIQIQANTNGIQFSVDRGADGTNELQYQDLDPTAVTTFGSGGRVGFRWLTDNDPYHYVWVDKILVNGAHVALSESTIPTFTSTLSPTPTATTQVVNSPTPTRTTNLPTPTPTLAGPTPTSPVPTPSATMAVNEFLPGRVTRVTDLALSPAPRAGGYRLRFTAPDGDLDKPEQQRALAYDIRYANTSLSSEALFQSAKKIPNIPDPLPGGTLQDIDSYSLPSGPLYFAMKVIGSNQSELSNLVSGTPTSGAPVWNVPANRKVGIDLRVGGTEYQDYVYEVLFNDRNIDDHGILYVKDTVELGLAHNTKNAKPAGLWGGGTPGVFPNSSAATASLAGEQGVIRYRFDADGLRVMGGDQAYVLNGYTYGSNRYRAHKMFKEYVGPFTPKSFYDSLATAGYTTPVDRVGVVNGTDVENQYSLGYPGPDNGDEWHELAYWDDDLGWAGITERHSQASDGRLVWIVVNPKSPVISLTNGTGGRFFTTRPKAYFSSKVYEQTTYLSGNVTLRLTSLSPQTTDIQYRLGTGSWASYTAPILISTLNLPVNTPVVFETRYGTAGPVRRRTLVWSPTIATANETHPVIFFRTEEKNALWNRIQNTPVLQTQYRGLKTNGNQINALMGRDYEVDERIRFGDVAGQAMSGALVYALEGGGTLLDTTYTGTQVANKTFRTLLSVVSSYDPIGDESQAGQWSGPNGEMTVEWWDRGFNTIYTHIAYDLIAGLPGIDAIDDLKLREALAQESNQKMRFIHHLHGNWNLKASSGLLTAAYTIPSYDSPVFGGATNTQYTGNPFSPGISWREYVENPNLPEGLPGGPVLRTTLWSSVWEDGVSKESTSYDASGRNVLSYFLNIFAGYHNVNLMESRPEFRRAYEWSIRSRIPWNRNYPSYGQARFTTLQDFHDLLNQRFENYLNMGTLRWHYTHHSPELGINPNSYEPLPFVLVWHNPTYPAVTPQDTGSRAYRNNMIFQRDYTDPATPQLILWGRETSWEVYEAHRKDDSTSMTLNAFGERLLTNSDEPSDWQRSNSESQNVILVDDNVSGPVNDFMPSGPSRATIATIKGNLVTPFIDYGVMSTQLNSAKDSTNYRAKAQLDRHVLFPDHLFYVVLDDMKAPDGLTHTYGWTGHCHGTLDLTQPQMAIFTKASGRKLNIRFFTPLVAFENYNLRQVIDWSGSEQTVPYFIAKATGVGIQYLTALIPQDLNVPAATFQTITMSRGNAGRIQLAGSEYLLFCQAGTPQEVTVDGVLTTTSRFALAKRTGTTLNYIFTIEHSGNLGWQGTTVFQSETPRSFLYLPVDPLTNGPSVTTVNEQWIPD